MGKPTGIVTDIQEPATYMYSGPTLTFTLPQGQCAVHGIIEGSLSLTLGLPVDGHYCLKCYGEWIAKHVTKLEPVTPKAE